jgi:hypothetical protein
MTLLIKVNENIFNVTFIIVMSKDFINIVVTSKPQLHLIGEAEINCQIKRSSLF